MVSLTINGNQVTVQEGATILDAAEAAGVQIPTLCYLKDICDVGACRICVVEIEGDERLSAACNTTAREGMVIHTHSGRVLDARQVILQLMLSNHNVDCTACFRSNSCKLQKLCQDHNILEVPYAKKLRPDRWPKESPLKRDASKCVKCMRCMMYCEKVQTMGIWDISGSAVHLTINVADGKKINQSECSLCGQCIINCPVGCLSARDDADKVLEAIRDPEKVVIVQIAPAIRTAWAEGFDIDRQEASVGKMVAAVRALGVDYVFDTTFTADLTVMEEANELLERIGNKDGHKWPMFTSCCPGWVRYMKARHPELTPNLSTAKSPQQMFGAIAKTWFAPREGIDPDKIVVVSIMPCIAKKHECALPGMDSAGHGQDVDIVITNREFAKLIRSFNVNPATLGEEEFDDLLGQGSGAGVIFGSTGGVMEAALRSAHYFVTGENPDPDAFSGIRTDSGIKELSVEINGAMVRAAVVSGLGNVKEMIRAIESGQAEYDFVEVMACPGGCGGGGGQPINSAGQPIVARNAVLYALDKKSKHRFAHENTTIAKVYEELLEGPLSRKSHELLHCDHNAWEMPI